MRLINVETLTLEEFMVVRPESLEYAILSHTWEEEEVTFQDFTSPDSGRESKKGFGKIRKTCELARRDGIRYAWVDTCCIDKTSSAELTEAINSMFNWYRDAKVCYAWLADLRSAKEEPIESALKKCRWFTRGWTLQELLAPQHVEFYDRDWEFRGTKRALKDLVADASQIGIEVLDDPKALYRLSIAQRMSWAASRQTTRAEDMAYCLIGIFEVNMPMLYGEGERAFLRLQEEIVKDTNDLSIFAWKAAATDQKYHGIFANSPVDFGDCGSLELIDSTIYSPEFSLGNKGLRILTEPAEGPGVSHTLKLNCKDAAGGKPIGIWIHHHGGEVYSRTKAHEYGDLDVKAAHRGLKKTIHIFKHLDAFRSKDLEASHRHAFVFRKNFNTRSVIKFPEFPFIAMLIQPAEAWDSGRRMLHTQGLNQFNGVAYFSPNNAGSAGGPTALRLKKTTEYFLVAFGKQQDEDKPWLTVHGKDDKHGMGLIEMAKKDLKVMGQMARENMGKPQTLVLRDHTKAPLHTLTVSLNESTLDGQAVYFIDMDFGPPPETEA